MTEETGGEVTIMTPQEGELADSLAASAERIRAGVALMRSGLENYIEGVLRTAEELAKARKLFTADKAFAILAGEQILELGDLLGERDVLGS